VTQGTFCRVSQGTYGRAKKSTVQENQEIKEKGKSKGKIEKLKFLEAP